MIHRQGDIVLIPIPFTNLKSNKKRPVMIISNGYYNESSQDIIAVAITSNIRGLDYEVVIEDDDMIEADTHTTKVGVLKYINFQNTLTTSRGCYNILRLINFFKTTINFNFTISNILKIT